jgi:hypothetical protein
MNCPSKNSTAGQNRGISETMAKDKGGTNNRGVNK